MQERLTPEQMVTDESFINFCFGKNKEDINRWTSYLAQFPDEKEAIEEARKMVLGISYMFIEQDRIHALDELKSTVRLKYTQNEVPLTRSRISGKSIIKYALAAMLAGAILFAGMRFSGEQQTPAQGADAAHLHESLLFETGFGETKTVWLPDSSKVILNAKSLLTVDKDFGSGNRKVHLTGEALFDVSPMKDLPFLVTLKQFNIKVWGTVFNVKAYEEDEVLEAALLTGRIEIINNTNNNRFFLDPNKKAIIPMKKKAGADTAPHYKEPSFIPYIAPLLLNSKDHSATDTSWIQGKLDIFDKTFEEIKTELERMHGVQIVFKDEAVKQYRFSAAFEKESIAQILKALQLSYPFTFSIDQKLITISK